MKQGKNITMREVAKLAEVSVSSVSRYLADPKSIQPLAAYKIKEAIQDLDYQPNVLARNLKQNRSNTIGIVVPYIDYTFGEICAVAADYFYERNYVAFTCQTNNDPDKEKYYVQSFLSQAVAGLMIAPCGINTDYLRTIAKNNKNIVVLDRREEIGCDIVAMDFEKCSYDLAMHMLGKNRCDGITVFLGAEHSIHTRDSIAGIRNAFLDTGRDSSKANLVFNCHKVENVINATRHLYEQLLPNQRPAILALGTAFVEYAIIALNQFGDKARERVDLGGFSMKKVIQRLRLDIPYILHDATAEGIAACEVLLGRITKKSEERPKLHELKPVYYLK